MYGIREKKKWIAQNGKMGNKCVFVRAFACCFCFSLIQRSFKGQIKNTFTNNFEIDFAFVWVVCEFCLWRSIWRTDGYFCRSKWRTEAAPIDRFHHSVVPNTKSSNNMLENTKRNSFEFVAICNNVLHLHKMQ